MSNLPVPVDRKEIDEMSRLKNIMNIMNGSGPSKNTPALMEAQYSGRQQTYQYDNSVAPDYSQSYGATALSDTDVKDMKSILEKFHKVTDAGVQHLMEDSHYDPELEEALHTRRTPSGARIAKWEIVVETNESNRKLYNVVNSNTQDCIAENLSLYEAALALVKCLNQGKKINSREVLEIMNLEESYNKNRTDAVMYRRKAEKSYQLGNDKNGTIYESRFEHSKSLALESQKKIKKLTNLLK